MTENKKRRPRTCIVCGKQADKVDLHRIVRCEDGSISFDASGRRAGRGAYICSLACLGNASKARLSRALKCSVSEDDLACVAHELKTALEGACAR